MCSLNKKLLFVLGLAFVLFSASCKLISPVQTKPAQGTTGFYDFDATQTKIVTEDMKVSRMSIPGDRVFVYRVNDDMVVLGAGNLNANALIKPLDEVASGVIITPEAAKKLASFLEKAIVQYNIKDKKNSVYQDFRILKSGTVAVTAADKDKDKDKEKEKDVVAPNDTIVLRMQYTYNLVQIENAERTLCYFDGSASAELKELKINEITALITSLQKN